MTPSSTLKVNPCQWASFIFHLLDDDDCEKSKTWLASTLVMNCGQTARLLVVGCWIFCLECEVTLLLLPLYTRTLFVSSAKNREWLSWFNLQQPITSHTCHWPFSFFSFYHTWLLSLSFPLCVWQSHYVTPEYEPLVTRDHGTHTSLVNAQFILLRAIFPNCGHGKWVLSCRMCKSLAQMFKGSGPQVTVCQLLTTCLGWFSFQFGERKLPRQKCTKVARSNLGASEARIGTSHRCHVNGRYLTRTIIK